MSRWVLTRGGFFVQEVRFHMVYFLCVKESFGRMTEVFGNFSHCRYTSCRGKRKTFICERLLCSIRNVMSTHTALPRCKDCCLYLKQVASLTHCWKYYQWILLPVFDPWMVCLWVIPIVESSMLDPKQLLATLSASSLAHSGAIWRMICVILARTDSDMQLACAGEAWCWCCCWCSVSERASEGGLTLMVGAYLREVVFSRSRS